MLIYLLTAGWLSVEFEHIFRSHSLVPLAYIFWCLRMQIMYPFSTFLEIMRLSILLTYCHDYSQGVEDLNIQYIVSHSTVTEMGR